MQQIHRFATCLILLANVKVRAQDNFTPIAAGLVPQGGAIIGVRLPAWCSSRNTKVVRTIFTIEPSPAGNITILTSPPNLVRARVDDDQLLSLSYDEEIAKSASQGGVRVQMPNNQFQKFDACCSARGQILPGFTDLRSMVVSTSSNVQAVLGMSTTNSSSTTTTPLEVEVSTSGSLGVKYEGGTIQKASGSTSSSLDIVASKVETVDISTSGRSKMKLDTPIGSGDVTTSGSLKVSATGSCNNIDINTSGNCQDGDGAVEANFDVTVGQEFTSTGTQSCPHRSDAVSPFVGKPQMLLVAAASLTVWLLQAAL